MLHGNQIDVSESISINKTNISHKCKIFKTISFNKIAVASVEVNSYKSLEQL